MLASLERKTKEQIQAHNGIRHKVQAKMKKIEELEATLLAMEKEEESRAGEESEEAATRLRQLENSLDKVG